MRRTRVSRVVRWRAVKDRRPTTFRRPTARRHGVEPETLPISLTPWRISARGREGSARRVVGPNDTAKLGAHRLGGRLPEGIESRQRPRSGDRSTSAAPGSPHDQKNSRSVRAERSAACSPAAATVFGQNAKRAACPKCGGKVLTAKQANGPLPGDARADG
jgi:hypothetical protein